MSDKDINSKEKNIEMNITSDEVLDEKLFDDIINEKQCNNISDKENICDIKNSKNDDLDDTDDLYNTFDQFDKNNEINHTKGMAIFFPIFEKSEIKIDSLIDNKNINNINVYNLESEIINLNNSTNILCSNCSASFNDIISLNDHILIVHDNVFEDDTYSCEFCESELNSENELTEHLKEHASNIPKTIGNSLKLKTIRLDSISNEDDEIDFKDLNNNMEETKDNEYKTDEIILNEYCNKTYSKGSDTSEISGMSEFDDSSEENEIDNVPTNAKGRHICPTCSRRYLTEYLLGSHFMIAHGRYDRMLELDDIIHKIGFPGLDILKSIGMINELSEKEIQNLILKSTECLICREYYKLDQHIYISRDREISGYFSDGEVERIKKNHKNFKLDRYYPEDDNENNKKKLDNSSSINKFKSCIPIIMTCCSKHICTSCLEQTLLNSNTLSCPFCNYDHTKYDQEYIIEYEIGELNKQAWIDWWICDDKHIKIFLPK